METELVKIAIEPCEQRAAGRPCVVIYLKLGIDLAQANGDGTWRLPVPARFVIDRQGIIRAVDADPDYTRRSEPARTVEILKGLPMKA